MEASAKFALNGSGSLDNDQDFEAAAIRFQDMTLLSRIPFFSPITTPSGDVSTLDDHACAVTKILQCRFIGPSFASVEDTVEKLASDNRRDRYIGLKCQALRAVHVSRNQDEALQRETWTCVLFNWKVTGGASSEDKDEGDLVFVNANLRRWLVVETGDRNDEALYLHSKRMGNLLFATLMYLGIPPEWVRATTYTYQMTMLPIRLLERAKPGVAKEGNRSSVKFTRHDPMLYHEIDMGSFEQGLPLSLMNHIETVILPTDPAIFEMVKKDRSATGHHSLDILKIKCLSDFDDVRGLGDAEIADCPGSRELLAELKKAVTNAISSAQPHPWPNLDPESKQQDTKDSSALPSLVCSFCKRSASELGLYSLLRCSRCKQVFYCGKACQSDDWKDHKTICFERNEEEE